MATFSLTLQDESIITGTIYDAPGLLRSSSSIQRPLIVAVHGGSFTADYFDADVNHSWRPVLESLGIPAIALNRPGYGSTTPPTILDKSDNSFIQTSGKWLHELALPAIWNSYGKKLGISSMVLYGHSIGAGVCIVAAAEYEKQRSLYKLSGLFISGVGSKPVVNDFNSFFEEEHKSAEVGPLQPFRFPAEDLEKFMLGSIPEAYNPAIVMQLRRLQNNIYLQELYDIEFIWPNYWESYAQKITIPVMYTAGELDPLWHINEETTRKFGDAFSKATWVSLILSRNAPHTIELSHQSRGYYIRLVGFAVECAAQFEVELQRQAHKDPIGEIAV